MAKVGESINDVVKKIDQHDLARVEKCGVDMHEATEGKISVSSIERKALGIKSPALLEQDREKSVQER